MSKQSLHQVVNQLWYGNNKLWYLLSPLSSLFNVVASIRKTRQLKQQFVFTKPIIIVGNITVGGTGKTPMVVALVNELKNKGFNVGVASRGYKSTASKPLLINQSHRVEEVGDEPILIYNNTDSHVMVGSDRLEVIRTLIEGHQCDLVICDDGLQDYRFKHDVEIIMVDGERGFGNQQLLPAGPLRENMQRLQSADFVVTTTKVIPAVSSDCMKLDMELVINLVSGDAESLTIWQDRTVHAVAAIGNPQRFFNALRMIGLKVHEHEYPDHAGLQKHDIIFDDDYPVVMTEKDAVKCIRFNVNNAWYIPIKAIMPNDLVNRIVAKL